MNGSSNSMDRWKGRSALVTGGTSGIGLAAVKALLKHGMTVVSCSRNPAILEKLRDEGESKLISIRCDISKEDDIRAMFAKIKELLGHVDVLINNAAVAIWADSDFLSGDSKVWKQTYDANIYGTTLCIHEAIKLMDQDKVTDGHIINLNSVAGENVIHLANAHPYSVSKHAVKALSTAVHMELRGRKNNKIRVTNMSPGVVFPTIMSKDFLDKNNAAYYEPLKVDNIVDTLLFVLSCPPHMNIQQITVRPTDEPHYL